MNRKQRRAEKKAALKLPQAASERVVGIDEGFAIALKYHQQGNTSKAKEIYSSILQGAPNHILAMHNLALIIKDEGNPEQALPLLEKILEIEPDHAETHNSKGVVLYDLGFVDDSLASYQKALTLNPNSPKTHRNIGNILKEKGQLEEALEKFQDALKLNPNDRDSLINFGVTLIELLRPEEAVACFKKVLGSHPDFAEAYYNMGNAYNGMSRFEEAMPFFQRAINLKPDFRDSWTNLSSTSRLIESTKPLEERKKGLPLSGIDAALHTHPNAILSDYSLYSERPHEAGASYDKAMNAMAGILPAIAPTQQPDGLASQTIGLLHFGRSGTGLMHSLIDNHPEISTLPSIYLSGYFNEDVWGKLTAGDADKLLERFMNMFDVLFDATSLITVPSNEQEDHTLLGFKEGMTVVGDNHDEVLRVDRDAFRTEALRLLAGCDNINAGLFLRIVHAAYESAIGTSTKKDTMFFHIHNPGRFARFNFLNQIPDTRLLMMIRNPVQCCESWLKVIFHENEYKQICGRITNMLFSVDQIAFRRQDSIGVRLEDLKARPKETMQALCEWMGIEDTPSLYEMTAQGKKWWGDPSSPDYDNKKGMSPFDDVCLKRPTGSLFSESDRFLLETLFHPFSVRFGYRENDPHAFKRDLKEARAMLEGLLDYEKVIMEEKEFDEQWFRNRVEFLSFRISLNQRFDMLEELGTYPQMLKPLRVDKD